MQEIGNLYFAPVSTGDLYSNFEKSILNGIDVKMIRSDSKKLFNKSDRVKLWGIRDAKKTTFLKTKPNDMVCFYQKGNIVGYGRVHKTFIDEELSKELWGVFLNKLTNENYLWQNIIWIEDFHKCNINFNEFIKRANYSEKFSIRGYLMLNSDGRNNILSNYKTFDAFFKENDG